MITIAKDRIVSMRYIMKNSQGEVLADTMAAAPVSYLHGSMAIEPTLQAQLEGLGPGDRKQVYLRKGAGGADDEFSFDVLIGELRAALPEEMILGYPVMIQDPITAVDADCGFDCTCRKKLPV
jgi:FKBP-type peptidyl-prolyl cis-trans isomerase 2